MSRLLKLHQQIEHRIGRRGSALLTFTFIDFTIAYSLTDSAVKHLPAYQSMIDLMPLAWWSVLWIIIGLICGVSAFTKSDVYGFTAAIAIKVIWSGCFLASWIIHGANRAWLGAATWAVIANFVFIIAGWPEPLEKRPRESTR